MQIKILIIIWTSSGKIHNYEFFLSKFLIVEYVREGVGAVVGDKREIGTKPPNYVY